MSGGKSNVEPLEMFEILNQVDWSSTSKDDHLLAVVQQLITSTLRHCVPCAVEPEKLNIGDYAAVVGVEKPLLPSDNPVYSIAVGRVAKPWPMGMVNYRPPSDDGMSFIEHQLAAVLAGREGKAPDEMAIGRLSLINAYVARFQPANRSLEEHIKEGDLLSGLWKVCIGARTSPGCLTYIGIERKAALPSVMEKCQVYAVHSAYGDKLFAAAGKHLKGGMPALPAAETGR